MAEIIDLLDLEVHPRCWYVAETYRSKQNIPREALPNRYDSARPFGSVLYFLVTRKANISVHRTRSDQMYHHYLGDPLEVLLLYPDGSGRIATVGPDLRIGMRPQLFIPGGTFHVARLKPGSSYALLGTTEWPGVEPSDVELGSLQDLGCNGNGVQMSATGALSKVGSVPFLSIFVVESIPFKSEASAV